MAPSATSLPRAGVLSEQVGFTVEPVAFGQHFQKKTITRHFLSCTKRLRSNNRPYRLTAVRWALRSSAEGGSVMRPWRFIALAVLWGTVALTDWGAARLGVF